MKGYQILNFLSLDHVTNKIFKGFVMRDFTEFPHSTEIDSPSLIIINTDEQNGYGEHWCVAYIENNNFECIEFFDSFGLTPQCYMLSHLFMPYKNIICSGKCVQSLAAKTCGAHCLFFSYLRCRNFSMQNIVSRYHDDDLNLNDDMVSKFVNQFGKKYKF